MTPQPISDDQAPPAGALSCLLVLLAGWVLLGLVLGALVATAGWLVGWW